MSKKQKLALHFAWDSSFIAALCMAMVMHSGLFFFLIFTYALGSLFFRSQEQLKKNRELNTLEVLVWFTIGLSALWILWVVSSKGFFAKPALVIPLGVIGLAFRLLELARDWTASKNPAPATK